MRAGTITADLALLVAPGEVVGIDADAGVVAQAREHARDLHLANLRFEAGDLFGVAHPDASFDVVHLHQVLQHLADPVAALVELRRLLRPGGLLAARDSDYRTFHWAPDDPLLDRWLELYLDVTTRNGHDACIGPRLLGMAQRAGFRDVWSRARRGPTPTPRPGRGGEVCGPTGFATRASPPRPSNTN